MWGLTRAYVGATIDNSQTYNGQGAVILGGNGHTITNGDYGLIAGGFSNDVGHRFAGTVAGRDIQATGEYSIASGGQNNEATGSHSTVVGGLNNEASGTYSFAAGRQAKARGIGSFALTDSQSSSDFVISQNNTFGTRFSGGYRFSGGNVGIGIGTSTPATKLHVDGTIRFAALGAGTLQTDAIGNVSVSSDERLKDVLGLYSAGLDEVLDLEPIQYHWLEETGYDTETLYTGFSAQNVQAALPEAVGEDKRGFLTLSDRPIMAAAINAIKEIWETVSGHEDRIEALESGIPAADFSRITELEAELENEAERVDELEEELTSLRNIIGEQVNNTELLAPSEPEAPAEENAPEEPTEPAASSTPVVIIDTPETASSTAAEEAA